MKSLVCIVFFMSIIGVHAQNYFIGFAGTGASNTVETVTVENLTQCTSMNFSGADILNLTETVGFNENHFSTTPIVNQYPNPAAENSYILYSAPDAGLITLTLLNTEGKIIASRQQIVTQGTHQFSINTMPKGVYVLQLQSDNGLLSKKIISTSETKQRTDITYEGLIAETEIRSTEPLHNESIQRSIRAITQMQYNNGDVLKLTGKSGNYRTVMMLTPTMDETVTFTFISCTDNNSNHYSVVRIGNQWWMAENLNAGTFATITTPQASGTKFCMDINGQQDPTCPMGGLYEWNILMAGASACNGTGAAPDDDCATPVQGLCPNGWHIPSHYEWTTLGRAISDNPNSFPYDMNLGVYGILEGGYLKETCSTNWWSPNLAASDKYGFGGLPGGDTWEGVFEDYGQSAYFWTSSQSFTFLPWVYALNYSVSVIGRSAYVPENGFSCRCVKD